MPLPLDIEDFFKNPKHQKEADFMRGVIKKVIAEEIEKKKKEPDEENLFDELFGGK